jgi:hypothetical protein
MSHKPIPVMLLYGGIAAGAMVVITFMTYKGGIDSFLNKSVYLVNLIPLACGVIAALIERKRGLPGVPERAAHHFWHPRNSPGRAGTVHLAVDACF